MINYIEDIAKKAKKEGRKLLVVESNGRAAIATTENPKMIADQVGEALAAAVFMFHSMSEKEGLDLTIEEVFDGVMYACFARANKMIKSSKIKTA